jgi:carbamoyltransferase
MSNKKPIVTVGISRVHNSAVTLLVDGELVFHMENERLSNIKYDSYPFHLLSKLPNYVEYVDNICLAGVGKTVPAECFTDHDVYTTFISRLNKQFFQHEIKVHDLWDQHHKLHAACAFYNSGFTDAVCIIKDGMGSDVALNDSMFKPGSYGRESASTFVASYPANFELVENYIAFPYNGSATTGKSFVSNHLSEAMAFQKTSVQFGFHTLDAGKVMGMSSYGVYDENIPLIYEADGLINRNLFVVDNNDLTTTRLNVENYPYLNTDNFQIQANFAWALQRAVEQVIKQYIHNVVNKTGKHNVCLSGGFFLNCVANYEFLKDLPSNINVYVEPISSDAGTSLGAAKYVWHKQQNDYTVRPQRSLYHGLPYSYTEDIITDKIQHLNSQTVSSLDVAKLLADKKIVAIYQGKSEAGPRALGNRSILYDPRDPNGKDYINTVKKREWFRPFAGTVLHEYAHDWFDLRGLNESPFMMFAVDVNKNKQDLIPAITHVDGTCRIQTLTKEQNKHYYELINEFYKLTNVPILFNTSFNLAGDCIVETIDDAINTLQRSAIDYLYLPEFNVLVSK